MNNIKMPSEAIHKLTEAAIAVMTQDKKIAPSFFNICDASHQTSIPDFAKMLEEIATIGIGNEAHKYSLCFGYPPLALNLVDWLWMASLLWNDYSAGQLRNKYAPDWLKERKATEDAKAQAFRQYSRYK